MRRTGTRLPQTKKIMGSRSSVIKKGTRRATTTTIKGGGGQSGSEACKAPNPARPAQQTKAWRLSPATHPSEAPPFLFPPPTEAESVATTEHENADYQRNPRAGLLITPWNNHLGGPAERKKGNEREGARRGRGRGRWASTIKKNEKKKRETKIERPTPEKSRWRESRPRRKGRGDQSRSRCRSHSRRMAMAVAATTRQARWATDEHPARTGSGSPKQRAKKIPGRPGAGANSRLVVAAPASVPVVVVVVVVVVVAVAVVLPTTAPATAAAPAALLLLRGTWTVSVVAVFNTN